MESKKKSRFRGSLKSNNIFMLVMVLTATPFHFGLLFPNTHTLLSSQETTNQEKRDWSPKCYPTFKIEKL
jgi:hypothetical protein